MHFLNFGYYPYLPYSLLECKLQKLWYTYTMECYSAIKRNKIGPFAEMWMSLKTIRENEVRKKKMNIVY